MTTAELIGIVVFHSLWQGAIIGGSFLLSSRFLGQNNPQARYRLAGLHLIWMLGWVAYTAVTEYQPGAAAGAGHAALEGIQLDPALWLEFFRNKPKAGSWMDTLSPWAGYLWMLGVVVFSVRTLGGLWYVNRLRRQARPVTDPQWLALHERLTRQMNLSRPVTLALSRHIGQPMAVGVFRPMVLFPVELMTGLPMADLEMVLLHELAHIRRADYLINLVQHLLEITFFYHPVVWWISRDMRRTREASCDDLAVGIHGDAISYAQTLTRLQRLFYPKNEIIPMTYLASPQTLRGRIERLFVAKSAPSPMLVVPALVVMVMLIAFHPWNNPALARSIEQSAQSLFAHTPKPVSVVPDLTAPAAIPAPVQELPGPQAPQPAATESALPAVSPQGQGHTLVIEASDSRSDLKGYQADWEDLDIRLSFSNININDGRITALAVEVKTEFAFANFHAEPFDRLMIHVTEDLKHIHFSTNTTTPPPPPPVPAAAPGPGRNNHVSPPPPPPPVPGSGRNVTPAPTPAPVPAPAQFPRADTPPPAPRVPAGQNLDFLIRDNGHGMEPMFILDGKVVTKEELDRVDVDDIDHMNVLKGEHAESRYGAQGSNGVIEIATKGSGTSRYPRPNVSADEFERLEIQTAEGMAGDAEPIYLLDGAVVSKKVATSVPNNEISGVMVIKAPQDEQARQSLLAQYGEAGLHGVVEITTKAYENSNEAEGVRVRATGYSNQEPIIYLDGRLVTQQEVGELSPDQIKSVNVLKGEAALEQYGEAGRNGVIEITTK